MLHSIKEDKNIRFLALIASFLSLGIVILVLILIKLITPIPPFPESASSGGMEVNYGVYNEGTGTIEENQIGNATNVVVKEFITSTSNQNKDQIYTSESGEEVLIPTNSDKPIIKENTTFVQPKELKEQPKEKTAAEVLAEKFQKNKGKSGGDGQSGIAGNAGEPEGNPFTHGKSGTGNNPDGIGIGSGKGTGNAPFGFDLRGRSLVYAPELPKDTKEEGIVVVDIIVDKDGNVKDADPNGRGTTTNSPILKAKARQFALKLKFNPNPQFEEQKGSITIVFSFK